MHGLPCSISRDDPPGTADEAVIAWSVMSGRESIAVGGTTSSHAESIGVSYRQGTRVTRAEAWPYAALIGAGPKSGCTTPLVP